MKTALLLLSETIEDYNSKVSDRFKFNLNSVEASMFEAMMIKYANMHVEESKKQIIEKAYINLTVYSPDGSILGGKLEKEPRYTVQSDGHQFYCVSKINPASVINAYTIENIYHNE